MDKDVRTRLLNLMETREDVTLKKMLAEADRLNKIKADTKLGSSFTPGPNIHNVEHPGNRRKAAMTEAFGEALGIDLQTTWETTTAFQWQREHSQIFLLEVWPNAHVR